jgi:hypothetical protein
MAARGRHRHQRTVAGVVDVTGIANPTANVTVNGNTASRKGEYFHYPLSMANSTPQYPTIQAVSQYGATQSESRKKRGQTRALTPWSSFV